MGKPFRPPVLDAAWLTPSVVEIAQAIYTERTFERMPELANALERSGCTDTDILEHGWAAGTWVRNSCVVVVD